ncbi:hypothetical protein VOLCADRAFT_106928 [Volvox carteri f. nagariensis]|uniref:SET domain-containing protein n=1 Tax=Volvox carteri f. nagariensis TaxID=3068 RepID=D8UAM1_VOLCA|nr:uncharacterized protein VOLCADRAFT_106928 [Volvox carteri f. nagariensis]EFJ43131.1 hypothetical protein VOLCADRAFT_106928 [Volvox carteri f. nagariensis]|eukprot:XP_002955706.1 hypothetical protein VOLCADRAFT_106928 [Volvox carteri f. nagariensis]
MPRLLPAWQPPCRPAMRSNYLLGTRRWAVSLADHCGLHGAAAYRGRSAAAAASSQPFSAAQSNDASDLGPELMRWLQLNGGRVDGVTLANLAGRDGASGWGLQASQDLEPGRRLIVLPAACHLTYGAKDDPRLLALIEKVPNELWGAKLALQLLSQRLRGADSLFAAYISNLPRGIPGIPMFFSKRALDLIDYPPVTQQVQKRCRWLHTFSQQVMAKLPGSPEDPFGGVTVDINALGWALACVTSRAFRTRGPAHPAAMLPLIDMANHTFTPNAEVLPLPGGDMGLFAKSKVATGEPLLLSYGKLNNDFLFMDYGFIVPDNPYDTVQLRFDIGLMQAGCLVANVTDAEGPPRDLVITPWRQELLTELGLAGAAATLELNLGGPDLLDPRLLAAARVMVARQAGEVAGRGGAERLCAIDCPLSRENETAALRVVGGVIAVALSTFRRTLDQDLALLAGQVPPSTEADGNQRQDLAPLETADEMLAVRFCVEKKRILSRSLQRVAALAEAVKGNGELRQSTGMSMAKKGSKPAPATNKGFGQKK